MNTKLALLSVLLGTVAVANADLVTNGGFETYNGPAFSSYYTITPADNGFNWLSGWSVGLVSIDIVDSAYSPISGKYMVDLAGTPAPGLISQTLATSAGQQYEVSFDARYTGDMINRDLTVLLGTDSHAITLTASNAHYSFLSTAASANEVLTLRTDFANHTSGNEFVDNVSVQAVPEPAPFAMLGLGLLGLVRRRSVK